MQSRAVISRRFPTIRRQNNCWFHIDLRGRIGVLWLFLTQPNAKRERGGKEFQREEESLAEFNVSKELRDFR